MERTNKKLSGYAVRGILIAILTVLLLVLIFASAGVERSYYERKQTYAVEHYEEISEQMLKLWEDEKYYAFTASVTVIISPDGQPLTNPI